jgi:hypothetical protein
LNSADCINFSAASARSMGVGAAEAETVQIAIEARQPNNAAGRIRKDANLTIGLAKRLQPGKKITRILYSNVIEVGNGASSNETAPQICANHDQLVDETAPQICANYVQRVGTDLRVRQNRSLNNQTLAKLYDLVYHGA